MQDISYVVHFQKQDGASSTRQFTNKDQAEQFMSQYPKSFLINDCRVSETLPKYRVLYRDNKGFWQIKACFTKYEMDCWMIGNPDSIFLRYVVVMDGGKLHYDTKEEAIEAAKIKAGNWSLLYPGKELPSAALEKAYSA